MSEVTNIADQIACIEREIKQRKRVYPRWVEQEKMTQALADREMKRMEDVLATLEVVRRIVSSRATGNAASDHAAVVELCDAIRGVAPMPPQGSLY